MRENSDQDKYAGDTRIDELLNSFIDGELTVAEQAEVERLITQDVHIARRLRQLQKCRVLVGSLPRLDVPAEVSEGIRASLSRMTIPGQELAFEERIGKRHLLARRLLSAAAMIGLLAILGGVIHTILTPHAPVEKPAILATQRTALAFSGTLELRTSDLPAVNAFINTIVEENGLSDPIDPARRQDRRIYSLNCSRKDLNLLMANLETIWPELDSATLFVDTTVFGRQVAVKDVTTEQIARIAGQSTPDARVRLAKDINATNTMVASMPGQEILAAIDNADANVIRQLAPIPVLTGKRDSVRKAPSQTEQQQAIRLTIVVNW
jgi:anti-sigma factor RsiW